MVIGLIYGSQEPGTKEAKRARYAKVEEFMRKFAEVNGSQHCRDLLGIDLISEQGLEAYSDRNLKEERCMGVVSNAVRVLLELVAEWGDRSN
jgi:C_GCAxxG_C_C family probable redox protein